MQTSFSTTDRPIHIPGQLFFWCEYIIMNLFADTSSQLTVHSSVKRTTENGRRRGEIKEWKGVDEKKNRKEKPRKSKIIIVEKKLSE